MHAAMWANGAWTIKQQDVAPVELSKLMDLSASAAIYEDETFCED
jgi:hypothetical protein